MRVKMHGPSADISYQQLIERCRTRGHRVITRNAPVFREIDAPLIAFDRAPLVTLKRTAWEKAIREMEWFLSGDSKCPDELLDWWKEQLCFDDDHYHYYFGYGHQFINFGGYKTVGSGFDQIKALIDGIKAHPYSRRHVVTAWNPGEMTWVTRLNRNEKTPATCHGTVIQFFVQDGQLHMKHYQRSADIVLGVPHNWIQYWALLLWIAVRTGLKAGTMQWIFGDLHLYDEPSHLAVADAIIAADPRHCDAELVYRGNAGCWFKATDFELVGAALEPVTAIRARLL